MHVLLLGVILTSILRDHLHPRSRVDLHQGVRDENDMHSVEDRSEYAVPEAGLPFEIQYANHVLSFSVVARHGQHTTV